MIYLANPSTQRVRAAMSAGLLGAMTTPDQRNALPDDTWWAADNGVYGSGYPGDSSWLGWLRSRPWASDRCLFATAPDVVGDAWATMARSLPWLPAIRAAGWPAAFVAQDGAEDTGVPWNELDCLFLGGSTAWKLSDAAACLAGAARSHGKWVHCGRVNSRRRYEYAAGIGCDSVDGTFLAYGPDVNLDELLSWARPPVAGHSWRAHRTGRGCGTCPGPWERWHQ
jgi:hypothetical protein